MFLSVAGYAFALVSVCVLRCVVVLDMCVFNGPGLTEVRGLFGACVSLAVTASRFVVMVDVCVLSSSVLTEGSVFVGECVLCAVCTLFAVCVFLLHCAPFFVPGIGEEAQLLLALFVHLLCSCFSSAHLDFLPSIEDWPGSPVPEPQSTLDFKSDSSH